MLFKPVYVERLKAIVFAAFCFACAYLPFMYDFENPWAYNILGGGRYKCMLSIMAPLLLPIPATYIVIRERSRISQLAVLASLVPLWAMFYQGLLVSRFVSSGHNTFVKRLSAAALTIVLFHLILTSFCFGDYRLTFLGMSATDTTSFFTVLYDYLGNMMVFFPVIALFYTYYAFRNRWYRLHACSPYTTCEYVPVLGPGGFYMVTDTYGEKLRMLLNIFASQKSS